MTPCETGSKTGSKDDREDERRKTYVVMGGLDEGGKEVAVGTIEGDGVDVGGRDTGRERDEFSGSGTEEGDSERSREGVSEVSVLVPADGVEGEVVGMPAGVPGCGDDRGVGGGGGGGGRILGRAGALLQGVAGLGL